jgi:dTDP-4-amino-4,6-dideoxygalactose transaminase
MQVWNDYHDAFASLESKELVRRPVVPAHVGHNAHIYYLLLRSRETRDRVIADLAKRQIEAVFHYVPLHSSRAGRRYGRVDRPLPVTDRMSDCLVRLPLWAGMDDRTVDEVVDAVASSVTSFHAVG